MGGHLYWPLAQGLGAVLSRGAMRQLAEERAAMMEGKYTPGPWTLHPRVKEDPPHVYYDGCIVATVDTSAPDDGERNANAALIAAAPELLEACRTALQRINGIDGIREELPGTIAQLSAAIAKAEGGQQ